MYEDDAVCVCVLASYAEYGMKLRQQGDVTHSYIPAYIV